MKQEILRLREEVMHLKTTLKDEMLAKVEKLDSTLEQISKENQCRTKKGACIHKEEITNSHRGKRKNRLRTRRIEELYA